MITFTGVSFFKAITPLVMTVSCFQSDKINREASVLVAVSTMTSFLFQNQNKNFFSVLNRNHCLRWNHNSAYNMHCGVFVLSNRF
jgi:hypothetical protein